MTGIASVFSVIGTVVSAAGTLAAGAAQKRASDFEAQQYDIKAKEEKAIGQQQGFEAERQKKLALSSMQARAAASGLGGSDPTVLDLDGEVEKYGTLQQQMAQYGGDVGAADYTANATAARISGQAAQTSSFFGAAGTLASGASSLFSKYGGGYAVPRQGDFNFNPTAAYG